MKRNISIALIVVSMLVVLCIPSFASDEEDLAERIVNGQKIRVGVIFTSDTFEIPDDLTNLVTSLFNTALSHTARINVVQQQQLLVTGQKLGFNRSSFSNPLALKAIGDAANIDFMVWTRINYDVNQAMRNEVSRAIEKLIKIPKAQRTKHLKPDFDIRIIDVASSQFVFNNKFDLDLFTNSMKQQLINKTLSGNSLFMGSLDRGRPEHRSP